MIFHLDNISKSAKSSSLETLVFCIIMILINVIFSLKLILILSIKKPMEKIKNATNEILDGNLNINIRTNNSDELGELSNAISNMAGTVLYIIDDINELFTQLNLGNTDFRINTNKYKGSFKETTQNINNTAETLIKDSIYIAENIKEIEQGNFHKDIKQLAGNKSISTDALKNIQLTLKALSSEIKNLKILILMVTYNIL